MSFSCQFLRFKLHHYTISHIRLVLYELSADKTNIFFYLTYLDFTFFNDFWFLSQNQFSFDTFFQMCISSTTTNKRTDQLFVLIKCLCLFRFFSRLFSSRFFKAENISYPITWCISQWYFLIKNCLIWPFLYWAKTKIDTWSL